MSPRDSATSRALGLNTVHGQRKQIHNLPTSLPTSRTTGWYFAQSRHGSTDSSSLSNPPTLIYAVEEKIIGAVKFVKKAPFWQWHYFSETRIYQSCFSCVYLGSDDDFILLFKKAVALVLIFYEKTTEETNIIRIRRSWLIFIRIKRGQLASKKRG